jgi:hypothetical protein
MPQFNNTTVFQEMLYQRRRNMGKGNRKRNKRPQRKKWIYPHAIERQYWQALRTWMKPLTETAYLILQANLMNWVIGYNLNTEKQDSIRMDAFVDEFATTIEELQVMAQKA